MHGTIDFWERREWEGKRRVPLLIYGIAAAGLLFGAYAGMRALAKKPAHPFVETPRALLPSPARRRTKIDRWTA